MKLGILVNDIGTEEPGYTTTRLAMAAINRGHEVWVMGAGDLAYDADELIHARVRTAPRSVYKSSQTYLNDLQGPKAKQERITVDDLDILLLRNDPSADLTQRTWAQAAGIIFGRVAMRHGVIVLNDPAGLSQAMNKMYFQLFPEEVRPRTVITRDRDEIRAFWEEQERKIVLKPLQVSGGQGVFLVRENDGSNLNQMIEAVSRDGFVIAQEYLPAAEEGEGCQHGGAGWWGGDRLAPGLRTAAFRSSLPSWSPPSTRSPPQGPLKPPVSAKTTRKQ